MHDSMLGVPYDIRCRFANDENDDMTKKEANTFPHQLNEWAMRMLRGREKRVEYVDVHKDIFH